jgi:hypothetical protein
MENEKLKFERLADLGDSIELNTKTAKELLEAAFHDIILASNTSQGLMELAFQVLGSKKEELEKLELVGRAKVEAVIRHMEKADKPSIFDLVNLVTVMNEKPHNKIKDIKLVIEYKD